MNRNIKIFCLGGLGLLLSGCIASERDMGTLKLQLKELNDTIAVMQVNQAELASKMEELNQNLAVSNENLSQLDAQIFNLSTKLDDIDAAVKSAQGPEGEAEKKVLLPSDIFNEAKNHLNKQAYDMAVSGFKLYIEKYPEGENVEQAYIYLGDAYFNGYYVEKNLEIGFGWYMKSAAYNNVGAVLKIADLYEKGIVVEKNYQKAYEYYSRANAVGNYEGKAKVREYSKNQCHHCKAFFTKTKVKNLFGEKTICSACKKNYYYNNYKD